MTAGMDNVSVNLVIWGTGVNQVCAKHSVFINHWDIVSESPAHDPYMHSELQQPIWPLPNRYSAMPRLEGGQAGGLETP